MLDNSSNVTVQDFVVYSNQAEQVASSLVICITAAITLFAQSVIITAICRTPSLHESYFFILAVYCAMDMFTVTLSSTHYTVQFIYGYPPFPMLYWKIVTVAGLGVAFGLQYHVALIAYERYIYFCRPYSYHRLFSTAKISAALATIYVVPTAYVAATEIMIGRVYHASVLTYNLPTSPLQILIQFGGITIPSAVVTVFSVVRVWRLIKRQTTPGVEEEAQMSLAQQVRKTVRMILLISGAFWGTMFPAQLIRTVLFSVGYTWDDLDTRRVILPLILIRLSAFIYSLASIVHPLIFYHSRRDLKLAVQKMFRSNNVVQPAIET